MNPKRRSLCAFAMLAGSYALLTLLYVLPIDHLFMLRRTSSVFYLIPAVCLTAYFSARMIDQRVRKYLIKVGAMIILWCILRAAKYIAFEEDDSIARLIWYLYYIPMLAIPQFSFQAALSVGLPENQKLPWLQKITGIAAVVCIALVLTNDMHQMVFRFHSGFADWDSDYYHEPLFWVIMIWDCLFSFFSVAVLFRKCRLSASRKLAWIPAVYLCLGLWGLYLLNTGSLPRVWGKTIGEFPDMACYTLGGFWILCISIGLVPSNKGYDRLLQETSLSALLTDLDHKAVYQSRSAVLLTDQQLALSEPFMTDENTRIYRSSVTGGYAYWKVDISELSRINRELEEAGSRIAEEAELIRQANALNEKRALIDAKTKVYNEIAARVLPQSKKISILSAEAEENPERFADNMRYICIYAAYIKRMSNMMLLSSEDRLHPHELALAFYESVRYLNTADIPAEVTGEMGEIAVSGKELTALYEHFEILLEQALPSLQALYITLSADSVKLCFEDAALSLPNDWNAASETEDTTTFVRLFLRGEGNRK